MFDQRYLLATIRGGALVLTFVGSLTALTFANTRVEATAEAEKPPTPLAIQTPTPAPRSVMTQPNVVSANTTTQSAQGQQYGQSGFVGEPINLNVVNADVRDILNYITEQYGVNFVIDSSVGAG